MTTHSKRICPDVVGVHGPIDSTTVAATPGLVEELHAGCGQIQNFALFSCSIGRGSTAAWRWGILPKR
ncbi:MAG: hypothetical protein J4F49_09080 [Rhodobacteraceae bacterium]|nr:hypothetical protein [Paracoccaceae bacterium]